MFLDQALTFFLSMTWVMVQGKKLYACSLQLECGLWNDLGWQILKVL